MAFIKEQQFFILYKGQFYTNTIMFQVKRKVKTIFPQSKISMKQWSSSLSVPAPITCKGSSYLKLLLMEGCLRKNQSGISLHARNKGIFTKKKPQKQIIALPIHQMAESQTKLNLNRLPQCFSKTVACVPLAFHFL